MGREPQKERNRSLPRHAERHSAGVNRGRPRRPLGLDTQRSAPRHPTAWLRWLDQARRSAMQGTPGPRIPYRPKERVRFAKWPRDTELTEDMIVEAMVRAEKGA